jgi:hypothetical protein
MDGLAFPKPTPRARKPPKRLQAKASMKRGGFLNRKTRIKQRRAQRRRSGRRIDRLFLAAVRAMPASNCCARGMGTECGRRITADHMGERPKGRKADDDTACPMCVQHHQERTDYHGAFWTFTKDEMREWCDQQIKRTRIEVGRSHPLCCCAGEQCLGRTYFCKPCGRRVPWCFGAGDDRPDICDDCWAAAEAREAA